jgi:hypothetical protein
MRKIGDCAWCNSGIYNSNYDSANGYKFCSRSHRLEWENSWKTKAQPKPIIKEVEKEVEKIVHIKSGPTADEIRAKSEAEEIRALRRQEEDRQNHIRKREIELIQAKKSPEQLRAEGEARAKKIRAESEAEAVRIQKMTEQKLRLEREKHQNDLEKSREGERQDKEFIKAMFKYWYLWVPIIFSIVYWFYSTDQEIEKNKKDASEINIQLETIEDKLKLEIEKGNKEKALILANQLVHPIHEIYPEKGENFWNEVYYDTYWDKKREDYKKMIFNENPANELKNQKSSDSKKEAKEIVSETIKQIDEHENDMNQTENDINQTEKEINENLDDEYIN